MNVLVTGADGFVGQWLVRALLTAGHAVTGAVRDGRPVPGRLETAELGAVRWVRLDLLDPDTVRDAVTGVYEQVFHLAGVASSVEAGRDPAHAWQVNALGTHRLLEALALRGHPTRVLVVSSAEVYGPGEARPRRETDPVRPVSVYAASKAAGEMAALGAGLAAGLSVVIARPFPHTGPGQTTTYVAPALLDRILMARRAGAVAVKTGNLDTVRELLDVRDVVAAYQLLLERGRSGQVYNVAAGQGLSIGDLFERLVRLSGARVLAEPDPALLRPTDVPHLVGDHTKITAETGWRPAHSLDETLQGLVDAQAH